MRDAPHKSAGAHRNGAVTIEVGAAVDPSGAGEDERKECSVAIPHA
jgi:hypothetical protein